MRQNFARLSVPSLQTAYTEALEQCKLDRRRRPPASIHVQVLVQAWKQFREDQLIMSYEQATVERCFICELY